MSMAGFAFGKEAHGAKSGDDINLVPVLEALKGIREIGWDFPGKFDDAGGEGNRLVW